MARRAKAWGTGARQTPRLTGSRPADPWRVHVDHVAAALARGDLTAARRAWRDAYLAAWRSPAWRGLADVGDAALRIGASAGPTRACAERLALDMYARALVRARQQRSCRGLRRLADAFGALGARETADACRRALDHLTRGHAPVGPRPNPHARMAR